MGKRGRILVAVMAIMVVGAVSWSIFLAWSAPREPMYKGRPLSYWLQAYDPTLSGANRPSQADADSAMYEAGTNAIPTLLRMVRAQDPSLKTSLLNWAQNIPYVRNRYPRRSSTVIFALLAGFSKLNGDAAPAIPQLIKNLNENPNSGTVSCSMAVLGRLGPTAADAVPALLRIAADTNHVVRAGALAALGEIHCDPDKSVPVLIAALHDPSAINRTVAARALWRFGDYARPAVPVLVQIILEPNGGSNSAPAFPGMPGSQSPTVRGETETALSRIDPETYARVVTNRVANPAR